MKNTINMLNKKVNPVHSLPDERRAIEGVDGTFQPDYFSGTGRFSIPLYTMPHRGVEPNLSLDYHSQSGNGPFGIGFSLPIPKISRKTNKTNKMIPEYYCLFDTMEVVPGPYIGQAKKDETFWTVAYYPETEGLFPNRERWENETKRDIFILSDAEELVPGPDNRQEKKDETVWMVIAYHPKNEGLFAKIEYWENETSESYWKVTNKENVTLVFGRTSDARIGNPEEPYQIFEWLLEETYSATGDKVQYSYKREDLENVQLLVYEQNRSHSANAYLHSIRYGNYLTDNHCEAWAFEVILDYGEYNVEDDYLTQVNCNPYQPTGGWLARLDPFSSYRSGFEIRTHRLCHNILLFHHSETEDSKPCLVGATRLTYQDSNAISQMVRVVTREYRRNDNGSYEWQAMPPLDLSYTRISLTGNIFEVLDKKNLIDLNGQGFLEGFPYEDASVCLHVNLNENDLGQPVGDTVGFVDLFGDGLSHRFRLRNGSFECWPDLRYGRFGRKIVFGGAPCFDHGMDPVKLFWVDIDGSGLSDLVLLYPQRMDIYQNQNGNSFSSPISVSLPFKYSSYDQICFADVKGNGSTCLVLTKKAEDGGSYFYDFNGGVQSHLLNRVDNNQGVVTRITYRSSTSYYRDARNSGRPWNTKLSFPVQVVSKTKTRNRISGSHLTTCYSYHDGYDDYTERKFHGFGYVEQWVVARAGKPKGECVLQSETAESIPSTYIRRWYHIGDGDEEITSLYRRQDYYRGDLQVYNMPDITLDEEIYKSNEKMIGQVNRALSGLLLREEIYARADQRGWMGHPCTVCENNYHVRQIQLQTNGQLGVFFICPRENINYQYNDNQQDPRVQHQFYLQVDEFGEVTLSCQVVYPNRQPVGGGERTGISQPLYPEPLQLKVIVEMNSYSKPTAGLWQWGILCERKAFEIGGLTLTTGYFNFDEIAAEVVQALQNQISNNEKFTSGKKQARLL